MTPTLTVEHDKMIFECSFEESHKMFKVKGSEFSKRLKKFVVPLGSEQLKSLKEEFPNLEVLSGVEYIHRLKGSIQNLHSSTGFMNNAGESDLEEIKKAEYKMTPYRHQYEGLYYLDKFHGGALFADCGCLAGDSLVKINRAGGSREVSLEAAFYKFHNVWTQTITSKVRSFKKDHIGLQSISDIKQSGVKMIYLLTLENGFNLKATATHEFLTDRGFLALESLSVGSRVMIYSLRKHQKKKERKDIVKKGDKRLAVGEWHPYARKQMSHQGKSFSYLLEEHRMIYEAGINGLQVAEFKAATYNNSIEGLNFIDPAIYDIHHIDGDHYNNTFSNLVCLLKSDHKKIHSSDNYLHFGHGEPEYSLVRSIEYAGEEMTYDIVCEDPHRNFVANGIVVHNSGKTAMSLWDIEAKIRTKKVKKSTTLIVGKLMTLETGWENDTVEFTGLSTLNLWEPSKSKVELGEKIVLEDHGEKPPGKGKSKSKVVIYDRKKNAPVILRGASDFKPRKHIKYKQSWKEVLVDGESVKYGEETLREQTTLNIRFDNIVKKIATRDHDIHIINHEGLIMFEEELIARGYETIIFDESTAIKNPRSKCFGALIKIAALSKYRRILSGTPSPQGPQDLWSQFFFLDWGVTFGPDYDTFVEEHFDKIKLGSHEAGTFSGYMIKPFLNGDKGRVGTFEYVESRLRNRIFRVKLRDCVDIPPLVESIRTIHLEESQMRHYRDMENQMLIELEDGSSIEVSVDIAKVAKLRQVTGGFVLNKDKQVKEVCKKNNKLNDMLSLLSEVGDEKVVIFAEYRVEIAEILKKLGDKAVAIFGGISDTGKIESQKRFLNDPSVKYIVCQPQSAAYGVNGFNKVSRYLIFYSLSYRADTIYQAIKRIERAGQKRSMIVFYLIAKDTIDEAIYQSTKDKENTQQKTIDVEILKRLKANR